MYPGATSDVMESMVTTPIEMALTGIDGVDFMSSTSSSGSSRISISLQVGADENKAITDIETSLSSVLSQFPSGVQSPIVRAADSSSTPDLIISYSSNNMSPGDISDYIMRDLQTVIGNVQGVGEVQILGNREYAMRIWLDPYKMRQYNITASQVGAALSAQNIQSTPGQLDRKNNIVVLNADTDNNSVEQFKDIVVKQAGSSVIKMADIAKIELGAQSTTTSMKTNGVTAVGLAVTYKNSANPLTTATLVHAALDKVELPTGLKAIVMRDSSDYINASVHEIYHTLAITIILVILIVILFLGSFRFALIPITAIPLSLCGTIIFMYYIGFTLNLLTMLAIVLAIGLVVDDAIVVMENIHRHMIMGKKRLEAAIIGIKELFGAIIGITVTLLAVFAPVSLIGGITGALFVQFSYTLAISVLISGFVAVLFTPMLCSQIITQNTNKFSHLVESIFQIIGDKYRLFLQSVIKMKKIIVFCLILILSLGTIVGYFMAQKANWHHLKIKVCLWA